MIVGEAPGREEIKFRIPFCGRSGKLLTDALEKAEVPREKVYVTNLFKGDVGEGNRNPTEDELDDHSHILHRELLEVNPKSILLLGAFATKEFLDTSRMKDVVGQSFDFEYGFEDRTLFPCYHPAYILRNRRIDIVFSFYSVIADFVHSVILSDA